MKTFEITYLYGKHNIELHVKVEHETEIGARLFVINHGAKKIISLKEIK